MKKKFCLLTAILLLITSCSSDSDDDINNSKPIELTPEEKEIVTMQYGIAFDMLDFFNTSISDDNFIVSPMSAQFALGMLANGAQGNTLNEITKAFGTNSLSKLNVLNKRLLNELPKVDNKVRFSSANSLWVNQNFELLQSYKNVIDEYYDAESASLDFSKESSVRLINQWSSQKTDGIIPVVLENPDANAVLYLINALYFKGEWSKFSKFDKKDTTDKDFTNYAGTTRKVPTMCNKINDWYYDGGKYQILRLCFGNNSYSINIILPSIESSLDEVLNIINGNVWSSIKKQSYPRECNLEFPKFKIDTKADLVPYFKHLGIKDVFEKDYADLSALSPQRPCLTDAFQLSGIEVNETGAEVASSTVISGMQTDDIPPTPIDFFVNRPFAFVIEEISSGTILFLGSVKDL